MTKRTRKQKSKNEIRDSLTYRLIGNKEVIWVNNAVDYVKKMGYIVIKPKVEQLNDALTACLIFITCVFFLSFFASAQLTDSAFISIDNGGKYPDLAIVQDDKATVLSLIDDNQDCFINCYAVINITVSNNTPLPYLFKTYEKSNRLKDNQFNYYIQKERKDKITNSHFKEICDKKENEKNKTIENICYSINDYNTSKEVISYSWDRYKGELLPSGNYLLKITANKKPDEVLDWSFDYLGITSDQIKEKWAWWNTTYNKKKNISGLSGNGYVLINVTYNSNMNPDFSDLRFTDNTETIELPYWIENKVNSINAEIRIKNNKNSSIFMYYKNSSEVSSKSNSTWLYGDSLYNYWTFDEDTYNANDIAPNGFNMAKGAGTINALQNGLMGNSFKFSSSAYLLTTSNIQIPNEFTILAYINKDETGTGGIIAKRNDAGTNNFQLYREAGGKWDMFVWGASALETKTDRDLTSGIWQKLIVTWNGTQLNFYQDGTNTKNASLTGTMTNDDIDTRIAHEWYGDYFEGYIDELAIWNKAITPTEAYLLTNQSNISAVFSSELGTIDYPTFDNITITNISSVYTFLVRITNTNSSSGININGINYTMTNISDYFSYSKSITSKNVNYYFWSYSFTTGYNQTILSSFSISSSNDIFISYDFTDSKAITLFIVLLIITILIYVFIDHIVGCIFFFVEGIAVLVNLENKLFGIVLIIASIMLAFRED